MVHYSRCHLRSAEKSGTTIPLDVLDAAVDIAQDAVCLVGYTSTQQAHSRDAPLLEHPQPVFLQGVNNVPHCSTGDPASESGILSSALYSSDSSREKKIMLISF